MILITGANGFVGSYLMKTLEDTVPAPSLRNATREDIRRIVAESKADTIIHTAAISDIATCSENPEASLHANVLIPQYLAEASEGKRLICCFSSDQVYSACKGAGPYREEEVNPGNLYAEHKLEMEKRVLSTLPSAVILRAEWMYDMYSSKGNYLSILLNAEKTGEAVRFSTSEYRGVTYLKEVAENMIKASTLPGGVYNFGSETTQSIYDITKDFIAAINKDILLEECGGKHNLWMNCEKARLLGIEFSDVYEGLIRCANDNALIS